jgi:hypothetical protein
MGEGSVPALGAFGYAGPACPHCARPLDPRQLVSGQQICAFCSRPYEAMRFDPVLPDLAVRRTAEAGPEGAHACANHAGNVAVTHCSRCGVFMCSLCRIDADAQVLCPGCFDRLAADGGLPSAIATYRDYGRQASMLAVLGLLVIFVGPIAGPACIYFAYKRLQQLKAQGEEGSRAGLYAVQVVGVLETILGTFTLVWMFRR